MTTALSVASTMIRGRLFVLHRVDDDELFSECSEPFAIRFTQFELSADFLQGPSQRFNLLLLLYSIRFQFLDFAILLENSFSNIAFTPSSRTVYVSKRR